MRPWRGHPIVARRLRPEPRMAYVSSLLSAEECAHIISITKEGGELHPSRVVNHEKGGDTGMRTHARTSESCRVSAVNDLVVRRAVQRAAYLAGLTPAHAEAVQVVHYDSGQEYRPHCDYFSPDDARYREKTLMQGNRLVSFFVYLSSCDAGGKTAFPQLGVGFAPEVGAAAMWYNIDRHGNLDERTLHAGEPVTHGEKWGMNIWLRERALRRPSTQHLRARDGIVAVATGSRRRPGQRRRQRRRQVARGAAARRHASQAARQAHGASAQTSGQSYRVRAMWRSVGSDWAVPLP